MPGKNNTYWEQIKPIGVLTTIPLILLIGPVAGYFLGGWIDRKFHIFPWLTVIFVALGFAASGREVARIVKEVTQPDESGKKTGK